MIPLHTKSHVARPSDQLDAVVAFCRNGLGSIGSHFH